MSRPTEDRGRAGRTRELETACSEHLRRTWLLQRLDAHLDRQRAHVIELLALEDHDLIDAVGGSAAAGVRREHGRWGGAEVGEARRLARELGLQAFCRCEPGYPDALRDLDGPPAVLHVAGDAERFRELCDAGGAAIVGARRATPYGEAVARALGRQLAGAGATVFSGMAGGIDSHAHQGALQAGGATIAVMPGSAHRAYPRRGQALHARILAAGAAVSEQDPAGSTRPWTFPARNRIIAALAGLTVVVEARERSGALVTAALARSIGRSVGAVPGMVSAPAAAGPNALLAQGAVVIRDAQDVLDALYGVGARAAGHDERPAPSARQLRIIELLVSGHDTPRALARDGIPEAVALVELATLELAGRVRRGAGGRFTVLP